jgi:hypothetical protein
MVMFVDKTGEVYNWVLSKACDGDIEYTPNDLTIGIMCDKVLTAGVIYSNVGCITYLSIYADNARWCTKANLTRLFELPFDEFKSKIVKCNTSHKNKRINKLLYGLKLRDEGHLRYTRDDQSHLKVFSITEEELKTKRWYKNV